MRDKGAATSESPAGQRNEDTGGEKALVERRRDFEIKKRCKEKKPPTLSHRSMNLSVDTAEEKKGSGPGAPCRPGSKGIPIRSKCHLNVLF